MKYLSIIIIIFSFNTLFGQESNLFPSSEINYERMNPINGKGERLKLKNDNTINFDSDVITYLSQTSLNKINSDEYLKEELEGTKESDVEFSESEFFKINDTLVAFKFIGQTSPSLIDFVVYGVFSTNENRISVEIKYDLATIVVVLKECLIENDNVKLFGAFTVEEISDEQYDKAISESNLLLDSPFHDFKNIIHH